MVIRIDGPFFKDEFGRTLLLRGVNLGGSSKVPYRPDGATHILEGFFDHRNVSFVGRPFPLAEADEHFKRLKEWGLTFLRLLVTWEAIEHQGPGIYDEEYLDYLRTISIKAGNYGVNFFIDPHQDVWSRFSGGDGAPGWTLEAVGFDISRFKETDAAVVHATYVGEFPNMVWPTNQNKLAAATMFTLFFGGNDFAPRTLIQGESAQEFLQRHYIGSIKQVAERLKDLPNVVGYDTLNEPLSGYIGWKDLNATGGALNLGVSPTPFQSMLLGAGIPQEVDMAKLGLFSIKKSGRKWVNQTRTRAWREGFDCIWRQNGVWDFDAAGTPRLLRPDHFSNLNGHLVNFVEDYYQPFAVRFLNEIRAVDPKTIIFVESEAGHHPPSWKPEDGGGIVFAPHWYDGSVLVRKNFSPYYAFDFLTHGVVFGPGAAKRSIRRQIARFRSFADQSLGKAPIILGEFGIPFDLQGGKAFKNGDFRLHVKALDRSFQAIEANLMNCTIWNYCADNTNQHGDQWNREDFSIFSPDQKRPGGDINSGGRALGAFVRPYPCAAAGEPVSLSFDLRSRVFKFTFRHDPQVSSPTEIYVPRYQYPDGYRVNVSDGVYEKDDARQMLVYRHALDHDLHVIHIMPVEKH